MAEKRAQRRLAAILAADVVGYSRLMELDEGGTLDRLKTLRREIFAPLTAESGGRIFKITGDGALAEFGSAVDAVTCAVAIQRALAERNTGLSDDLRTELRIGISLGDVIVEGGDLYGNGVNVAARMEGLAEPGGICISGNVYEHVIHSTDLEFEDLGDQTVKNIDRLVRCYRLRLERPGASEDGAQTSQSGPRPSDKPSIAVLPFDNLSGDPEQQYFSDGITEDIITALSRIRQFHVTARNTTFTLKNKAVDVQVTARELGVQYVLEGSVRKGGSQVRVTAQLIDGRTGNHLWAERYDRDLEDIFAIQDEVTEKIAGVIKPELERAEIQRVRTTKPGNFNVWDTYYRGIWHFYRMTRQDIAQAMQLFRQAIELDPNLSAAYSGLAEALSYGAAVFELTDDREQFFDEAVQAAQTAIELDELDPLARCALGKAYLFSRRPLFAKPEYDAAIRLNPAQAYAYQSLGGSLVMAGQADKAIPLLKKAIELSPHDLWLGSFMARLAEGYISIGQYEKAEQWAREALRQPGGRGPWTNHAVLIAALGHLGKRDEAQIAMNDLTKVRPGITCAFVRENNHMPGPSYIDDFVEGLRKAGLPE